jgi:hypothetical protein
MLDTTDRTDAGRWENLIAQAPAPAAPYRAAPGDTVYQISVGERTFMVAEDDHGGAADPVMAVLAEGDEISRGGRPRHRPREPPAVSWMARPGERPGGLPHRWTPWTAAGQAGRMIRQSCSTRTVLVDSSRCGAGTPYRW